MTKNTHSVTRHDDHHHHCIGPPCDICAPDPRDAEIARLKRALAAGPAALRAHHYESIRYDDAAALVEAAQAAAMKDDDKKGGGG